MRLIQITHKEQGRRVAVVSDGDARLLATHRSIHALAMEAIRRKSTLEKTAAADATGPVVSYDEIYTGRSAWTLLPAFDHPDEPARCMVAGTGLTHKASAERRQAMHVAAGGAEKKEEVVTDSMRMFRWGLEGGRPAAGAIGVQPEWFYKGDGQVLRAHNQVLEVPTFGDDGGEEPEIAGAYVITPGGTPRRVGFMIGNEFSDHVMERKNYLYLAPSKLRNCAVGPELVTGVDFTSVTGEVKIERGDEAAWSMAVSTGEANMSHSLANLEHHQFKYPQHRRPGDAHVHFYGADAFSFGGAVTLKDGDVMVVEWKGFGRPLRNPLRINRAADPFVRVEPL
ncbi:MAG: GguC protein [Planctomycetes bacterium]|nr:GguC protein [Planctomycetota bacterium]